MVQGEERSAPELNQTLILEHFQAIQTNHVQASPHKCHHCGGKAVEEWTEIASV